MLAPERERGSIKPTVTLATLKPTDNVDTLIARSCAGCAEYSRLSAQGIAAEAFPQRAGTCAKLTEQPHGGA